MSKFFELLKQAEKERKGSVNRNLVLQDIQAGHRDREVQDLQDRVEQLRQTIATLEADKKVLNQESPELKRQLQEAKSRLRMFSQGIAARDKRLEEVNQTHQALVGQLKTEIKEKASRVSSLEKEVFDLKAGYQQKVQTFEEDEILKGLSKEGLNRMAKKLIKELLTRARPIPLKVACPHCEGKISVLFRLRLKSKEGDAD